MRRRWPNTTGTVDCGKSFAICPVVVLYAGVLALYVLKVDLTLNSSGYDSYPVLDPGKDVPANLDRILFVRKMGYERHFAKIA